MKTKERILLFTGIILILIAPTILTLPAFDEIWDFSGKGEIGSTIGGITSPIVGLLGVIMVFFTFKEQVKANDKLENQIKLNQYKSNFEILQSLFNDIKVETEKIEYDSNIIIDDTNSVSRGLNAIKEFAENISAEIKYPRPTLNNFIESMDYILTLHLLFIKTINNIDLDAEFKLFITTKYKSYYNSHLCYHIDKMLFYINENDIEDDFINLKRSLLDIKSLYSLL